MKNIKNIGVDNKNIDDNNIDNKEMQLKEVLSKYKQNLADFEQLTKAFENDKVLKERDSLLERNGKLVSELEALKIDLVQLKKEKSDLQESLFSLYYSQKEDNVRRTFEHIYKRKDEKLIGYEKELVSLITLYEQSIQKSLQELKNDGSEKHNELTNKVSVLATEINNYISDQKQEARKTANSVGSDFDKKRKEFESRELTQEELRERANMANIELKFGTKITSAIGAFLIMLGLLYGAYLSYKFFGVLISDTMKTVLMYLVGIALIGVGEFAKKKNSKGFVTGLYAGGIGVMYLATTIGYFVFDDVLTSLATVIIIGVISVVSFLLATKNDLMSIAIFALIGGYMPLIDFSIEVEFITAMAIYLTSLNILALGISMKKNWLSVKYLSFVLSILTTVPFMFLITYNGYWNFATITLYATFVYIVFLGTAVYYPIKHNVKISIYENVLFVINTLIYSVTTFTIFENYFREYLGYGAILLFAVFFALSRVISKMAPKEKYVGSMLYITAFVFSFIAIPIQFGGQVAYFSVLAQSTILVLVGIHLKRNLFTILGALGMVASLGTCLLRSENLVNYGAFVVANILILAMYHYTYKGDMFKLSINNKRFVVYKWANLFMCYFYIWLVADEIGDIRFAEVNLVMIILVAAFNIGVSRIKIVHDKVLAGIMLFTSVVSLPIYLATTTDNIISLIAINILMLYALYSVLNINILSRDIVFTATSVASVVTTSYVLVLANLPILITETSFYLSLFAMILSMGYMVVGFKQNYPLVRKTMLGTVYLILAKIFFVDFTVNSGTERVISLIGFGVVLIFISYLYQKFSKMIIVDIDLNNDDNKKFLNKKENEINELKEKIKATKDKFVIDTKQEIMKQEIINQEKDGVVEIGNSTQPKKEKIESTQQEEIDEVKVEPNAEPRGEDVQVEEEKELKPIEPKEEIKLEIIQELPKTAKEKQEIELEAETGSEIKSDIEVKSEVKSEVRKTESLNLGKQEYVNLFGFSITDLEEKLGKKIDLEEEKETNKKSDENQL